MNSSGRSGLVRLHDEAGKVVEVKLGEAAVIPLVSPACSKVVQPVRKYFVVGQTPVQPFSWLIV
jgi:uncharacterized cupin superfamily protein